MLSLVGKVNEVFIEMKDRQTDEAKKKNYLQK